MPDDITLYEVTSAIKKIDAASTAGKTEILLEKRVVLGLRHLLRVLGLLDVKSVNGHIRDFYHGVAIGYE